MQSSWDKFLEEIADIHGLDQEERETFQAMFAEKGKIKSMRQLSAKLNICESAVKIRMGKVYEKFARICPGMDGDSRGKAKALQVWLNQQYSAQSKIQSIEATSASAIAPPNWREVCREMLETQKQNLRRQVTQMGFELNVHVPLGLVDRKHQPRRGSDFSLSPEQGSGFFQLGEEEIIKTYEHHEFLEQIIKQRQSKKSQGKRIAIIGEPGAGKTTLLEAIAFSPKTPGFTIWISLGSLGEKSLEEYLCQKWLKDALKTSDVTQQQKALEELFKSGEVLLLLDGVDEMPAPSPVQALAKIREELTAWVADARVVLTCRVNVWDASVNALQGFDTYRTLEFSYGDGNKPDQVREFICQWFSNTDKPELGERLRAKLDEDRHQRIRDLVKNPLRLSLLCQSWYFRQGDLPKTKASLYEQFTQAFYDWKEEQFPTNPTKRKELNAALGLLAREAIDKEKSRFGIRESFAIDVMGEDLFKLATEKLNWLVHIYNDVETDKPVYAFFHPTFQEYFAACAIPDWQFFLNHVPHEPRQGTYRIFEPQWKEAALLWLGQSKEKVPVDQKENFIKALVEFEDECGDFYGERAYFLAAAGIAEFKDCSNAEVIVRQLVVKLRRWNNHQEEDIIAALREIDCDLVIAILADEVKQIEECARYLEKIYAGTGNSKVFVALDEILNNCRHQLLRSKITSVLQQIHSIKPQVIAQINGLEKLSKIKNWIVEKIPNKTKNDSIALLRTLEEREVHLQAAVSSCSIDLYESAVIDALKEIVLTSQNEENRCQAIDYLALIAPDNQEVIKILIDLLNPSKHQAVCLQAVYSLEDVETNIPEVIAALSKLLKTCKNDEIRLQAARTLGRLAPNNTEAIIALVDLLGTTQDGRIGSLALANLEILMEKSENFALALCKIHSQKSLQRASSHYWVFEELVFQEGSELIHMPNICRGLEAILQGSFRGIERFLEKLKEENEKIGFPLDWDQWKVAPPFSRIYNFYQHILQCKAQSMMYSDFYYAWHGEPSPVQSLENKLIDIPSQVKLTDKTYPISIDTQTLKLDTNPSAIAQKFCTKIYRKADYFDIPKLNDAAQLQQYIPCIQNKLKKPNLALILHGCEPNEHLLNFCYSFADPDLGIYISLITNQPIEQPLKGFLSNQDNLLSAIQTWIDEIA